MNDFDIWNFLMKRYKNPYGVSALMGNLYVESKLKSNYLESSYTSKTGRTASEYVKMVDNGKISAYDFAHDSAGFGLAQWTYHTRKASLYEFSKAQKKSIADMEMQLNFLCDELASYKTVVTAITEATSVREASDVIVKRYEKPKNQTEAFLENRAKYGKGFYDKYAVPSFQVVATANVNIRTGNDKSYKKVGVLRTNETLPWVATASNGWHAVKYNDSVMWVSGEFSKTIF